jgi:O-antigen ligase
LVLSCFAATVGVGDLLYRELFLARRLPMFQSPIAARYLTVGTIEARISAWAALREVSLAHPLWGEGYAIMFSANRGAMDPSAYRPPISHNFLVELAFDVGVPGTLLFLWFVFQWLKEGLTLLGRTADRRVRFATRFVIAWAIGQVITGYLNGPSFMTSEFFLIAGAASGFQARASSFAFNRKKINQLCHASVSDPACCLGSQAANF